MCSSGKLVILLSLICVLYLLLILVVQVSSSDTDKRFLKYMLKFWITINFIKQANVKQYCSILYRMNWSGRKIILTSLFKERWQLLSANLETFIQRTSNFCKISPKNCSYSEGNFSANRKQHEILSTSSV